jgi:hypothetical protein
VATSLLILILLNPVLPVTSFIFAKALAELSYIIREMQKVKKRKIQRRTNIAKR